MDISLPPSALTEPKAHPHLFDLRETTGETVHLALLTGRGSCTCITWKAHTPKTRTHPNELRAALEEVRVRGYAVEDELSEEGMRAVAAPVRDSAGDVVAAIGDAGPTQRLSDAVLADIIPKVVHAASTISARIGYRHVSA